jgi:alpha-L-fucosidase 2
MGWKLNLWARFRDGDRAYTILRNLLRPIHDRGSMGGGGMYPNLFDAHPPFQIDGDFGATVGIAEMLLPSHDSEIVLLPALPQSWPEGRVTGLRARGGFEVDLEWKGGRLVSVRLLSRLGRPAVLRYGSATKEVRVAKGERYEWDGSK